MNKAEINYGICEKEALSIVYALICQWRVFVLGRPLTIITDHKALSLIRSCRLLNSRLTRWILFLQEFDFDIKHCRGTDNVIADTLSMFPQGLLEFPREVPNPINLEINAVNYVNNHLDNPQGSQSVKALYFVHEVKLYRKGTQDNIGCKLVLPKSSILEIVNEEHINYGHFGGKKCCLYLRRFYFFKKMRQVIRKIVALCDICQKTKCSRRTVLLVRIRETWFV